MLVGILVGDVPELDVPDDQLEKIGFSSDVLCWVLHHDHNDTFEKAMAQLKESFESAGYILEKGEDE